MKGNNLGQDLGRIFEVGFNIGILAYIEQNQLTHRFGDLYRQDLQELQFPKMIRKLANQHKVIDEHHRQVVGKWSTFFLQKGFLSGINFFKELIAATGWSQREQKKLEILYYQCCFANENSIGNLTKDRQEVFKQVLSQFDNLKVDLGKYAGKGEFLNADTLILLHCAKQVRIICVDLSVFSIKSIRDLADVNNVDVLRDLLFKEISYLKSKSVFANLGLDTQSSGVDFSSELANYFTAFKREDKESVKLIQAGSYAYSFYQFLRSHHLLPQDTSILFNVVGYSDRSINAMSVSQDNLDILATCQQIYQQDSSNKEIQAARQQVLNLIKRNAARSFDNGKVFVEQLLNISHDGITTVVHQERIDNFLNSIDIIPPDLATKLEVKPNSTLRDVHAELIEKALNSDATYIFLTGNPGIGKTTAIANFLCNETCLNEGFLFFYVSPRKQVNLDILEKFKQRSPQGVCDDRLFAINSTSELIKNNSGQATVNYLSNLRQDNFVEKTVHFIHQDFELNDANFNSSLKPVSEDIIQDIGENNQGVLNSICQAIYTIINRKLSRNIVATATIQSLKKLENDTDTLSHFQKIFKDAYNETEGRVNPVKMKQISSRIKHLLIMIDEVTGDDSGVYFLNKISKILKQYELTDDRHGFNTKAIVADASIVDPEVINQHLSNTDAEPNKIFFRKAKPDCSPLSIQPFPFKNNLNATVINANSYPAKSLNITYKVSIESIKFNPETLSDRHKDLKGCVQSQIVEDINSLLQNPTAGQIIVYVQDKPRLANLIEKIQDSRQDFNQYRDYLEIHANLSEQDKKSINQYKDNVKVIFMTASASRGLSFPQTRQILVDIPRFEIEKNLMEIIQVIYRGRGNQQLDSQDKELIFYLAERAVYYTEDRTLSLQESVLSLLNILLILKTSIMTRIKGYGQIGKDNCAIVPIGGKSIFTAGQTFSSKMSQLIKQLKKEHQRRWDDPLLKEVYLSLKQLLGQAEIVLRSATEREKQELSYLSLRESLTAQFLQRVNRNLTELLNFAPLETGYISGSLLIVPCQEKRLEENYKMRLGQEIINFDNGKLLKKMYEISRSSNSPENLQSAIKEAINLVNLLRDRSHQTQTLEQNSQNLDQYYALPLFTFISSETIAQYFSDRCEEPEDRRFRDLLESYLQSIYPINNILPIGHNYKEFPFITFRSYSLTQIRKKIFTDKYILSSNELNILNLILTKEDPPGNKFPQL